MGITVNGTFFGMQTNNNTDNNKIINSTNYRASQDNPVNDPLEIKRRNIRKQASKLINDAWDTDKKTCDTIKECNEQKKLINNEIIELESKNSLIEREKENLTEEYGIDKESGEYADVLLLEKYQNNVNGTADDRFSEGEIRRLKELQNEPLTEFQRKRLQLNAVQCAQNVAIELKKNELIKTSQDITDVTIEQLKSLGMIKAQDAAQDIIEAGRKDLMGMLVDESKKHLDEIDKEAQEKEEKIREEKEEREEQKEKEDEELIRSEMEQNELDVNSQISLNKVDNVEAAKRVIQKLIKDSSLLNEDLKGIEIDLNF